MGCGRGRRRSRQRTHCTQTHYLTAVFKKCNVQSGQDADATTIVHFTGRRNTPDRASIRENSLLSHSYAIWVHPSPWLEKDPAEGSCRGEGGQEGAERRGREGA